MGPVRTYVYKAGYVLHAITCCESCLVCGVQVCMAAQTQMFPKREAVQQLKDRLQAWCAEENRREQEGVALPGGDSTGTR